MSGNIVIVGSSGHARVVLDIVERQAKYQVAGFIDSFRKVGVLESGYEILGDEEALRDLVKKHQLVGVVVAIGDNHIRRRVSQKVAAIVPELEFVSAVHPSASIGRDVSIGRGTVVMAGVCVNPGSTLGAGCILNTRSSLDHDSEMRAFSSLAPGVTTGGNCVIGAGVAIGIGATLIHGITVGEHTVVGAGSTVLKDLAPLVTAFGTPARAVERRKVGDKYL
ncbi:MAG: sugar O-acyltransferase (sialic acid O-acetyltransferase NeuD family) [Bradymonadia bacterium]